MSSRTVLLAGIVFGTVLWIYWPAAALPFQFDDHLILRDENIQHGRWTAFVWPPSPRPLVWLSFLAQYRIHGDSAQAFHLLNLFVHLLNAGLVFLLLTWILEMPRQDEGPQRLRLNRLAPALGALVFALHPLQTESVFYVYQRSTLMASFFALLALLAWLREHRGFSLLFYLLALACKEFIIILPVVLWTLDGFLRGSWRPRAALFAMLATGSAAVGIFGLWLLLTEVPTLGGEGSEVLVYAATQVRVIWTYVGLTSIPLGLSVDHHVEPQVSLADPLWWLAGAALLAVFKLIPVVGRKAPQAAFFLCHYFLFLLPTSSLVPSQDFMFEHRVYLSLAGFAGLLSLLLDRLPEMLRGRLPERLPRLDTAFRVFLPAAVLLLLGLYGTAVRERSEVWSSPERLWRDAAAKSPRKYRPNLNLGVVLLKESPGEAVEYLERAVAIDPALPYAYQALGEAHLALRNLETAERAWTRALLLEPDGAEHHLNLGRLHARKTDFFTAMEHLEKARKLAPQDWRPSYHRALLLLRFGLVLEAIEECQLGLNLRQDATELRLLLADAVSENQNWKRAVELYGEVLRAEPDLTLVYYKLAQAHWSLGEEELALKAAEKGLSLARSREERELGEALLRRYGR